MQPLPDHHSSLLLMVTVGSKQCQHGNMSLGTHDDHFCLSGHLKLELPYIMDKWSDGEHSFLSFQIAELAGPPMKLTEVCHLGHFWLSYGRCVISGSPIGFLVGLSW